MAALPETLRALLGGRVVKKSVLVEFAFLSGTVRLWDGHGIVHLAGQDWSGLGDLGAISDLELPIGDTAPEAKFTLSGVDPATLARALGDEADWKRRVVKVFLQHFDDLDQPLDDPVSLYTGLLDKMAVRASGGSRTVEVTAQWVFARRAIPPFSELTDADQQARFPGDRFLEFVPRLQNFVVKWPAR